VADLIGEVSPAAGQDRQVNYRLISSEKISVCLSSGAALMIERQNYCRSWALRSGAIDFRFKDAQ
tara:strand:+ start:186 stop:380 length:195 start_codon:yes stop_codon:yes gene_type:complete